MKKIFILLLISSLCFAMKARIVEGPIQGIFVFSTEEKVELTRDDFVELHKHTGEILVSKEKGEKRIKVEHIEPGSINNKSPGELSPGELIEIYKWD